MATDRRLTFSGARPALTVAVVSAGLTVALSAWVMIAGDLPGERRVLIWIHDHGAALDQAMLAVSRSTGLLPLGVVAVCVFVALLVRHRRVDAMMFAAGVAVVWAVNPLLKELVGRSRPDLWPLADPASEYSFPSGHAANSAALVLALVMISRGRRVLSAVVAAVVLVGVGWSQLVLGRHFPSDILVGWLWAGAWIAVLDRLWDRS